MSDLIVLSEYDSNWPAMFESEKALLINKIGHWLEGRVEHVGSTAVPGLVAKPVIDVMFGVSSLEASKPAIQVLTENGYCYYPYKADVMHWFCKPSPDYRTHHLHLVPFESSLWQERLFFRDTLCSNPEIADQYVRLKKELAANYENDREAYTRKKWPFIQGVLDHAQSNNS